MKRACALAALALLAACAGESAVPVGSVDEMPSLEVGTWGTVGRGGRLRIGALNGRALGGLDATQTYLSPGPQQVVLDVLLCSASLRECEPIATLGVRFDAKPRRAYTARVDEQGKGSNIFRAWLTDDTGAIVAPGKP